MITRSQQRANLKRANSDSGISNGSNDSTGMQIQVSISNSEKKSHRRRTVGVIMNAKKRKTRTCTKTPERVESLPPVEIKPTLVVNLSPISLPTPPTPIVSDMTDFKITVNRDKKRAVNGHELIVTPEQEELKGDLFSDDDNILEEPELDSDGTSAPSSVCYEVVITEPPIKNKIVLWPRDEIDVLAITSKAAIFEHANLEEAHVVQSLVEPVFKMPNIRNSRVAITARPPSPHSVPIQQRLPAGTLYPYYERNQMKEDDTLSLHPQDNWMDFDEPPKPRVIPYKNINQTNNRARCKSPSPPPPSLPSLLSLPPVNISNKPSQSTSTQPLVTNNGIAVRNRSLSPQLPVYTPPTPPVVLNIHRSIKIPHVHDKQKENTEMLPPKVPLVKPSSQSHSRSQSPSCHTPSTPILPSQPKYTAVPSTSQQRTHPVTPPVTHPVVVPKLPSLLDLTDSGTVTALVSTPPPTIAASPHHWQCQEHFQHSTPSNRSKPTPSPMPQNPLLGMFPNLCYHLKNCQHSHCRFIHTMDYTLFITDNHQRLLNFWRKSVDVNQRFAIDILDHMPRALVETRNSTLLYVMVESVMLLPMFNRSPSINTLINSLVSINEESFEEIIANIVRRSNHPQLPEIIISIIVEKVDFLRFWSTLENLFELIDYRIDAHVLNTILEAAIEKRDSRPLMEAIYDKLLNSERVDRNKVTMRLLLAFTEAFAKVKEEVLTDESKSGAKSTSLGTSNECIHQNDNDSNGNYILEHMPTDEEEEASNEQTLKDLLTCHDNAEALCDFFNRNQEPRKQAFVIGEILSMMRHVSAENLLKYVEFLKESMCQCLISNVEFNMKVMLMGICLNILPWCYKHSCMKTAASLIQLFEDNLDDFANINMLTRRYSDRNDKMLLIFKVLVYGENFKLALNAILLDLFELPKPGEKDYEIFCSKLLKYLFDGLYKLLNNRVGCKDLLMFLLQKGFNVEDLQVEGAWDTYDFYRFYIRDRMPLWISENADILVDAHDSIFQHYNLLSFDDLRNILILLYKVKTRFDFKKFVTIFDSCNHFYNQDETELRYHSNISEIEIALVTNVFFYKMLKSNRMPHAVKVSYKTEPANPQVAPLKVKTSGFWDAVSIQARVKYALGNFDLYSIQSSSTVLTEITIFQVKHILEMIRRNCPIS